MVRISNGMATLENSLTVNMCLIIWQFHCKGSENSKQEKWKYMPLQRFADNVHSGFFIITKKTKGTKSPSTSEYKHIVVHPDNGILLSNKKNLNMALNGSISKVCWDNKARH